MNVLCQLILCYGSLLVTPEDKNHLLIIEQIITQIATNREALKVDRNAINKLLDDNDRLTSDVLNLQNKVLDLEKELKRFLKPPSTEDEVTAAIIEKLCKKLVRHFVRDFGITKSLCLIPVFLDDGNVNIKQQIAFESNVRRKLLDLRPLDTQEAVRLNDIILKSKGLVKDLVLEHFKTDIVVFLVIDADLEDSFLDVWLKESQENLPSLVPVQKTKQPPAPAQAPAPVQAPANFRFFKR